MDEETCALAAGHLKSIRGPGRISVHRMIGRTPNLPEIEMRQGKLMSTELTDMRP